MSIDDLSDEEKARLVQALLEWLEKIGTWLKEVLDKMVEWLARIGEIFGGDC